ncbi:hypothetical protein HDV05_001721, partial [Chytridiales sp. JEL 0842]
MLPTPSPRKTAQSDAAVVAEEVALLREKGGSSVGDRSSLRIGLKRSREEDHTQEPQMSGQLKYQRAKSPTPKNSKSTAAALNDRIRILEQRVITLEAALLAETKRRELLESQLSLAAQKQSESFNEPVTSALGGRLIQCRAADTLLNELLDGIIFFHENGDTYQREGKRVTYYCLILIICFNCPASLSLIESRKASSYFQKLESNLDPRMHTDVDKLRTNCNNFINLMQFRNVFAHPPEINFTTESSVKQMRHAARMTFTFLEGLNKAVKKGELKRRGGLEVYEMTEAYYRLRVIDLFNLLELVPGEHGEVRSYPQLYDSMMEALQRQNEAGNPSSLRPKRKMDFSKFTAPAFLLTPISAPDNVESMPTAPVQLQTECHAEEENLAIFRQMGRCLRTVMAECNTNGLIFAAME